jgi:hypothetical protein
MKPIMIPAITLSVLALGLAASVEAQPYEVAYRSDVGDDYVVVQHRRGVTIIEEPAPRVVIVEAPPPPRQVVLVRPPPPWSGAIWVEGHWQFTGLRFVWVRGHWIAPRYGYAFVQPRWHVHAGHHYYTPGYFRPYHAKIRHQTYRRYRPQPGYVYYRGDQRPYHRDHDHADRGRSYGPPHHDHGDRGRGYGPPHHAPGHRGADRGRDGHHGRAERMPSPRPRAQASPPVARQRSARGERPDGGRFVSPRL